MAKKPDKSRKIPTDFSMLTDEDKRAIDREVEASVNEEMSQDARDAYFAEQLRKLRRRHIPAERFVPVTISLAPYMPHLLIDNDQYFDGYTYDVETARAAVLYEQMQRSWSHQDEIDGRSRFNAYRRPRGDRIGPAHQNTPTRGANGIVTLEQ